MLSRRGESSFLKECLWWHCFGWHPSSPGTGHITPKLHTNRDGRPLKEIHTWRFSCFFSLQACSVVFLNHLVNSCPCSKRDRQKKKIRKKREKEKKEPLLLLLPTNAPHICYCIGSSRPDLTCKQWSAVNHQRPFTSPAAAGRFLYALLSLWHLWSGHCQLYAVTGCVSWTTFNALAPKSCFFPIHWHRGIYI